MAKKRQHQPNAYTDLDQLAAIEQILKKIIPGSNEQLYWVEQALIKDKPEILKELNFSFEQIC